MRYFSGNDAVRASVLPDAFFLGLRTGPSKLAPLYQINWTLRRLLKKLDDAIFLHSASRCFPLPHPRCPIATAASTEPVSLLVAAGVWPLTGAASWLGQPGSSRTDAWMPRVARQQGEGVIVGPAQAPVQQAAARPRHYPRPPAG
jgi:hypothetical protein